MKIDEKEKKGNKVNGIEEKLMMIKLERRNTFSILGINFIFSRGCSFFMIIKTKYPLYFLLS